MESEHCRRPDSSVPFLTSNYGITTTPAQEWEITTKQNASLADMRHDRRLPNPEELLVGALCSCHMLTFLAVAARKRHVVLSYTDNAVGTLAKDDRGLMCVTEVVLHPVVTFETPVDAETLAQLHGPAPRQPAPWSQPQPQQQV